jgi:metal-responsive CopG/Arc/MetJ family transcriptional regulator
MKRGATSKSSSRLVNIWIPTGLIPIIDDAVKRDDTDRSKYIRNAIREKLERAGIPARVCLENEGAAR